jgi:hypothetical protein
MPADSLNAAFGSGRRADFMVRRIDSALADLPSL